MAKSTNIRWLVFALGCGSSWFLYFHRYIFSLIKPTIAKEWELSNTELGAVDSAFAVAYSACQVPLGLMVDVMGPHFVLTALLALWSLAIAGHGWAINVTTLALVRGSFGAFQAGALAALSQVTRRWFPRSSRTICQGWMVVFSARMGGACSALIFLYFMMGTLGMSWRIASYSVAIAGMGMAALIYIFFRNSPREHSRCNDDEVKLIEADADEDETEKVSFGEMIGRVDGRSLLNLFALNLQSTLSTIADSVYSLWIPKFLFDEHNLSFKEMGLISSLPLIGGALGGAFGGFLNDLLIKWTGNRRWARTAVGLAGKMLAGIILLVDILFFYNNPYMFCMLLFVVKFVGDWSLSTGWGTITDIGGRATASVFAFNNSVAGVGGMLSPVLIGYVADAYTWTHVFFIIAVIYALCALSWLSINCTIPLFGTDDAKEL